MRTIRMAIKRMKQNTTALYYALRKKIPLIAKIVAGTAIGYLLSPIDLIPDFIPVLGLLDDLIIIPLLIILAIRMIPKEIWIQSKKEAARFPVSLEKKNWLFGFLFVSVWLWLGSLTYLFLSRTF